MIKFEGIVNERAVIIKNNSVVMLLEISSFEAMYFEMSLNKRSRLLARKIKMEIAQVAQNAKIVSGSALFPFFVACSRDSLLVIPLVIPRSNNVPKARSAEEKM